MRRRENLWGRLEVTVSFVRRRRFCALALIAACTAAQWCVPGPLLRAQALPPVLRGDNGPNSEAQQRKHYVVLVSLDGFRFDYPQRYPTPHLTEMAQHGVSTPTGMLPSFPSLTFPNHYSIVTGLYPEHHGIVGNSFYDAGRDQTYVYTRPESNGDGTWYGGVPLWSLAEQQGMRSACLFWPGSEAEIAGKRPSYYLHYNDGLDDGVRITQVIEWLRLPPEERPHFITLYYSNADHAGHAHGPDSPEVEAAVRHLDDLIGRLETELHATGLPVDLIVLADHGMVRLDPKVTSLSDFADLTGVRTQGAFVYPPDEAAAKRIYDELQAHPSGRFRVYRRAEVPEALHFNSNPRAGDPVVVPTGPFTVIARGEHLLEPTQVHGAHGFDALRMPEMKAIFYAEGPDIRANRQLPTFGNVDVYPFVAQILGLKAPVTDGSLRPLVPALTSRARHRRAK